MQIIEISREEVNKLSIEEIKAKIKKQLQEKEENHEQGRRKV